MPKSTYSTGTFSIQKISSYHFEFKRLINLYFKCVSTKYLNNYIIYYSFIKIAKNSRNSKMVNLKYFILKLNAEIY